MKNLKLILSVFCIILTVFCCVSCSINAENNDSESSDASKSTVQTTKKASDENNAPTKDTKYIIENSDLDINSTTTEPFRNEAVNGTTAPNLQSKESIVKTYIESYNKTKSSKNFRGKPNISIEKGTLKLEGRNNEILDNVVDSIIKTMVDPNATIALPPQGDEFFIPSEVKHAVRTEDANSVFLRIALSNVNINMKASGGTNSFFVLAFNELKRVLTETGVTWTDGRTLEECSKIDVSAEGHVTIDKKTGLITSVDYLMLVNIRVRHLNYLSVFRDRSGSAVVRYELSFPAR